MIWVVSGPRRWFQAAAAAEQGYRRRAMHDTLRALASRGWTVAIGPPQALPAPQHERYGALPDDAWQFLSVIRECRNPREDAWLLGPAEYLRSDPQAFFWNEHERMSIEAAGNDPTAVQSVRRFWDAHFPFMMVVHSAYDYLAIDVAEGSGHGAIVHGCAPEFEETSVVAPSFSRFLVELADAARSNAPPYPLGLFLS